MAGLPLQGIVMPHPCQQGTMLHTVIMAITKALDVVFGPLWLLRYGQV